MGDRFIPTDEGGQLLINYLGPPKTFPQVSVTDILRGKVPRGAFEDRIVLVGATALGTYDLRNTPFSPLYPGIEVHASVIDSILTQSFMARPEWSKLFDLLAIVTLGARRPFLLRPKQRRENGRRASIDLAPASGDLLVMGGSQGAQRINRALGECLVTLLERHPRLRVTHQCGARDAEWAGQLAASLSEPLRGRYTVAPFFDDIAARICDADLVVMRAGGSSLAEVSVLGRPMLLVPYPHARAHQVDNAMPYVHCGAARMLSDEQCTGERLRTEVEAITGDPERWREMARASAAAGRPDAAQRVVDLLVEVARVP